MEKFKFLPAIMLAAAVTALGSCNNDDDPTIEEDDNICVYPALTDEEYLERMAAQMYLFYPDQNVFNYSHSYEVSNGSEMLPDYGSAKYAGKLLNTQVCVADYNHKSYLLVVLSDKEGQECQLIGNKEGEATLQQGLPEIPHHSECCKYSANNHYVWIMQEINFAKGANIVWPLIINNNETYCFTNHILVQSKTGVTAEDLLSLFNMVNNNGLPIQITPPEQEEQSQTLYLPKVDHNAHIEFDYNNETITLRGCESADLDVKYETKENVITISAEKSTGKYMQAGTALLLKNGFSQIVQTKEYAAGQPSVSFDIDSKSITDNTEYRIALVTEFVADNGYRYRAGYYSAPLVLNPSSVDDARSYTVSPSIGSYVGDAEDNSTIDVKANWNNGRNPYYVTSSKNCDVQVKVMGINKNTISIKCIKEGGYILNGKIYVFQGISPQKLWHGNILGEKAYKGGYLQTDVDVEFDVSHITRSTKFCVVILPDDPDGNGDYYGYYTGTITVTPEKK